MESASVETSGVLAELRGRSQLIYGEKVMRMETHVESQRLAAVLHLITVDADKRLTVLEETSLQTDNDELHARSGVVVNVVGDASHVRVIEGSINLVEHEEGRRLV